MSSLTNNRRWSANALNRMAQAQAAYGGSPAQLMRAQVRRLLNRQRQLAAFPVNVDEFTASLFPDGVFRDHRELSIKERNLLSAVAWAAVITVEVEGEVFWVRRADGRGVPTPTDVGAVVKLDPRYPYYEAIVTWFRQAGELHVRLDNYAQITDSFLSAAKHPRYVREHWPGLLPFIGADSLPPTMQQQAADDKPNVRIVASSLPSEEVRLLVENLLAECSLLSDVEVHAWVGYYQ